MEILLADELTAMGISELKTVLGGITCEVTLKQMYHICLWSRIANRVLLELHSFHFQTINEFYDEIQTIDWEEHLAPQGSFIVEFNGQHPAINHTHFGALKVKDAIVDQFRQRHGTRPDIDTVRPDVRVDVRVHRDKALISLDISGESLHRRNYRLNGVLASLKENLAAAMLWRGGWKTIAQQGGSLVDPMCGAGTLLIEAAWMAADIAPQLQRDYFGFSRWQQHVPAVWKSLREEALEKQAVGLANLPPLFGYDIDAMALKTASQNIERAQLTGKIHLEKRALAHLTAPDTTKGLLISNPPYGERLGEWNELKGLYSCLGEKLKQHFQGWHAAILTNNLDLAKEIGMRADKIYSLYNGALKCKLLTFEIFENAQRTPKNETNDLEENTQETTTNPWAKAKKFVEQPEEEKAPVVLSNGAQMFANRLRKNLKTLGEWAQKNHISCYRLYDADMPEYAVAVDIYEQWVHVQEYAPPKSIDPEKAHARWLEALDGLQDALQLPRERLFIKVRQRQKGKAQYQRLATSEKFYEVHEGKAVFLVNFSDYLDTGLFLDHRITRARIAELSQGKRFLNLFAYTGTATVHAALGGATYTTTVDMSPTYLSWARKNLMRNGFSDLRHEFIEADCMQWLQQQAEAYKHNPKLPRYDVIFLDPPTFSNSKKMENVLDVQRDHYFLIEDCLSCLKQDGVLIFSNNHQGFKLDVESLAGLNIKDCSKATLPKDFERNPKIHQCWEIRFK